tara:strand:+ start:39503 stop:39694 length:192 start_codon:yes stop_codon:yes gene_type:complete
VFSIVDNIRKISGFDNLADCWNCNAIFLVGNPYNPWSANLYAGLVWSVILAGVLLKMGGLIFR